MSKLLTWNSTDEATAAIPINILPESYVRRMHELSFSTEAVHEIVYLENFAQAMKSEFLSCFNLYWLGDAELQQWQRYLKYPAWRTSSRYVHQDTENKLRLMLNRLEQLGDESNDTWGKLFDIYDIIPFFAAENEDPTLLGMKVLIIKLLIVFPELLTFDGVIEENGDWPRNERLRTFLELIYRWVFVRDNWRENLYKKVKKNIPSANKANKRTLTQEIKARFVQEDTFAWYWMGWLKPRNCHMYNFEMMLVVLRGDISRYKKLIKIGSEIAWPFIKQHLVLFRDNPDAEVLMVFKALYPEWEPLFQKALLESKATKPIPIITDTTTSETASVLAGESPTILETRLDVWNQYIQIAWEIPDRTEWGIRVIDSWGNSIYAWAVELNDGKIVLDSSIVDIADGYTIVIESKCDDHTIKLMGDKFNILSSTLAFSKKNTPKVKEWYAKTLYRNGETVPLRKILEIPAWWIPDGVYIWISAGETTVTRGLDEPIRLGDFESLELTFYYGTGTKFSDASPRKTIRLVDPPPKKDTDTSDDNAGTWDDHKNAPWISLPPRTDTISTEVKVAVRETLPSRIADRQNMILGLCEAIDALPASAYKFSKWKNWENKWQLTANEYGIVIVENPINQWHYAISIQSWDWNDTEKDEIIYLTRETLERNIWFLKEQEVTEIMGRISIVSRYFYERSEAAHTILEEEISTDNDSSWVMGSLSDHLRDMHIEPNGVFSWLEYCILPDWKDAFKEIQDQLDDKGKWVNLQLSRVGTNELEISISVHRSELHYHSHVAGKIQSSNKPPYYIETLDPKIDPVFGVGLSEVLRNILFVLWYLWKKRNKVRTTRNWWWRFNVKNLDDILTGKPLWTDWRHYSSRERNLLTHAAGLFNWGKWKIKTWGWFKQDGWYWENIEGWNSLSTVKPGVRVVISYPKVVSASGWKEWHPHIYRLIAAQRDIQMYLSYRMIATISEITNIRLNTGGKSSLTNGLRTVFLEKFYTLTEGEKERLIGLITRDGVEAMRRFELWDWGGWKNLFEEVIETAEKTKVWLYYKRSSTADWSEILAILADTASIVWK